MVNTTVVLGSALGTLTAVVALLDHGRSEPSLPGALTGSAERPQILSRLPAAFVPNVGQWENGSRYVARIGATTVSLGRKGWTFILVERAAQERKASPTSVARSRGVALRMTFAGDGAPELVAEQQLLGCHNYFIGNDPAKWRSRVPLYRAVRYREVQPGVDIVAREESGHFEYDLVLQPRASLQEVEIAVEGIERMHLDRDGALVLETRLGPVRMPAPLSWEEGPSGQRSGVTCRYALRDQQSFGFEAPGRRPGWALVVDPGLAWSTFFGGANGELIRALALDAQGGVVVAGSTNSANLPTTPGAFDLTPNGDVDAFVTKLSPTGSSLLFSTFLGGTKADGGAAILVDARGAAIVAGGTASPDFPTTPGAFDTTFNGANPTVDGFVTRLAPTGSSLEYSTLVGGVGDDGFTSLALDAQGAALVAGSTTSANFPATAGAFSTRLNGPGDAVVSKLDMLPTGVAAFGRSSPGCAGPLAISVTSMPRLGNASFALTCASAPPSANGLLVFAAASLASPVIVLATEVWIDATLPTVSVWVSSTSIGSGAVTVSIPNSQALAGGRLFAQFFWAGPNAPSPCPPLSMSASSGLDITVQP